MIIRLDDFPQGCTLPVMQQIEHQFSQYDGTCTLTVLAGHLNNEWKPAVELVNNSHVFDIQLHGWLHESYPDLDEKHVRDDLYKSLTTMDEWFHIMPTVWYLPWNGWTKHDGFNSRERLEGIANDYGLTLGGIGIGAREALTKKTENIYFHAWHPGEMETLPKLLEKYERHLSEKEL